MLYPDATHDPEITEDPMVEEFTASLVGSRIVVWPSLKHQSSPLAPTQLHDESPAAAAYQLEDEDPAVVSYEQTPPPCPI